MRHSEDCLTRFRLALFFPTKLLRLANSNLRLERPKSRCLSESCSTNARRQCFSPGERLCSTVNVAHPRRLSRWRVDNKAKTIFALLLMSCVS